MHRRLQIEANAQKSHRLDTSLHYCTMYIVLYSDVEVLIYLFQFKEAIFKQKSSI